MDADPQIVANCPELTPLSDKSFGATSLKLIEVSTQYYKCCAAARGESCVKQKTE